MAIEKMTFLDIRGGADVLDRVLIRCAGCGLLHLENASRLSEYSIGDGALAENPYGGLLARLGELAGAMDISLDYDPGQTAEEPPAEEFIPATAAYLDKLSDAYARHVQQQADIRDAIVSYTAALDMLDHVDLPGLDFDQLWSGRFLKVRFGRMPEENVDKLSQRRDKPYEFFALDTSLRYTWCLYLTAEAYRDEVDAMFASLGFDRLHIPEYVHGTAKSAMETIQEGLAEERERLAAAVDREQAFLRRELDRMQEVYGAVRFLHDAYGLRRYAVILRGQFHLIGFVQTRRREAFAALLADIPTVLLVAEPASESLPIPVPVKLRNGWFVRPFRMFVEMYGFPSYGDIDPTPFVAATYTLLFGMMFGDLGHGLCVFVLGLFLGIGKGMDLGRIMSRIGLCSMAFGFCYGSVFGLEELLDPFFTGVLGLPGKPVHVMDPATTNRILAAAIGIGAVLILVALLFNICVGIKRRDPDRVLLSSNGLPGLVFYSAALYAGAGMALGRDNALSARYILCLLALPLVLVFFREPVHRLRRYRSKSRLLHSDAALRQSARFREGGLHIPELFGSAFLSVRFGRLPTDSYRKLGFYDDEAFLVYPLKADREYIWCLYAMAAMNKREVDAIFADLYFERVRIPQEDLASAEQAEAFIRRWVEGDTEAAGGIAKPPSLYRVLFPAGFGGFLAETFFELFEVVLSFVTNTMSFLRVGGFILVHAGMMEVVFQLSAMVGGGAGPVVIVVGNVFVMAMEGLIVGIQVLRLEFYEMFSRFHGGAGEPFVPCRAGKAD